jgi:hypothetical protein
MSDFTNFWKNIAAKIQSSPRPSPSILTIPRNHIDKNQNGELDYSFKKDQHYFQVMVNEMYLTEQRILAVNIEPLVYTVCEFTYLRKGDDQNKTQFVPFLIGPSLLKDQGVPDQYSKGIIFRNTSVSGLHPYRGGGLTLAIVLMEARQNALRPVLQVVEAISGALKFSPALAPYLSVASVLMDGFETFFNAGGVEPLVGLRDSFGPNYNIPFRPGYFVMIDKPGEDEKRLWVVNNQLMVGSSLQDCKPYREADFVLYSFIGPEGNERDDTASLPFNDLWLKVKEESASPVDDPNYKNARMLMGALYQTMVTSPDLTEDHSYTLADNYFASMQKIHAQAVKFGLQSGGEEEDEETVRQDKLRQRALKIASGG